MTSLRQTPSNDPIFQPKSDSSAKETLPNLDRDPAAAFQQNDVEPASVVHRCLDNTISFTAGGANSMVGALSGSSPSAMVDSDISFERRMFVWAESTGLFCDDNDCPGAASYIRTAYQLFPETEIREAVAKYMLLVAMGDVLLDKRLHNETPEEHQIRLAQSVHYLRQTLEFGVERVTIPNVAGAEVLAVITRQWQTLLWSYAGRASQEVVRQWIRALDDHYAASVREWLPEVVANPLIGDLCRSGQAKKRALIAIQARNQEVPHAAIALRIEDLLRRCRQTVSARHPAVLELRLWMYLLDVNTIGAGLAFRTAALALSEARVPAGGLGALQQILPLLDMRIRLANDGSGFFENSGQDRDEGKINSCSILIASERERDGAVRPAVMQRTTRIFRSVCRQIDAQLDETITQLVQFWPEMGQWVLRGRKIGVRAYEVGHYTTLDREAFTSLLEAS